MLTGHRTHRAKLTGPGNQYSAGFSRPMIHAPNVNPNQKMSHNSSTPIHTLGVSCGFELPHSLPSFQFVERVCSHHTMSAARSALVAPLLHPGNSPKMPKKLSHRQGFQLRLRFSPRLDLFSVQHTMGPPFWHIFACRADIITDLCHLGGRGLCRAPFWHHFQRFLFGLRPLALRSAWRSPSRGSLSCRVS